MKAKNLAPIFRTDRTNAFQQYATEKEQRFVRIKILNFLTQYPETPMTLTAIRDYISLIFQRTFNRNITRKQIKVELLTFQQKEIIEIVQENKTTKFVIAL